MSSEKIRNVNRRPEAVLQPRFPDRPSTIQGYSVGKLQMTIHPKPLLRKRHTKSRKGCRGCRTRRVKCDEDQPSCRNCLSRGILCQYPFEASYIIPNASPSTALLASTQSPHLAEPSSPFAMFSSQEIGFFHYFLTSMSHPLPLGNHSMWLKEIPQIAQEYGFLMHAILALGASEFQLAHPGVSTKYESLKHRGLAISGLNSAINNSEAWNTGGHPDALLATCYALIYQSSHIGDGLQDFEIFVRGSALITERIRASGVTTALKVAKDWPRSRLELGIQYIEDHVTDLTMVEQGLEALDELRQCLLLSSEEAFFLALRRTLVNFLRSPAEGYVESMISYGTWYYLAEGLLKALRKPNNLAALILISSFCANMVMIKILIPIEVWPIPPTERLPVRPLENMLGWVEAIRYIVPKPMHRHLDWSQSIFDKIPRTQDDQSQLSSAKIDARLHVLENLETKAHILLGDIVRRGSQLTAWFDCYVYARSRKVASTRTTAVVQPKKATDAISDQTRSSQDITLLDGHPASILRLAATDMSSFSSSSGVGNQVSSP